MDLVPMSQESFEVYIERLIVEYADDKLRAGNWPAEIAQKRSREDIMKLLPQGTATEGQALYELFVPDETEAAGVLWLTAVEDAGVRKAFIYDLWIRPDLRRRGLATQAMLQSEAWVRSQGLDVISLHVFGHNQAALDLYNKLGYQATNINMTKRLS